MPWTPWTPLCGRPERRCGAVVGADSVWAASASLLYSTPHHAQSRRVGGRTGARASGLQQSTSMRSNNRPPRALRTIRAHIRTMSLCVCDVHTHALRLNLAQEQRPIRRGADDNGLARMVIDGSTRSPMSRQLVQDLATLHVPHHTRPISTTTHHALSTTTPVGLDEQLVCADNGPCEILGQTRCRRRRRRRHAACILFAIRREHCKGSNVPDLDHRVERERHEMRARGRETERCDGICVRR